MMWATEVTQEIINLSHHYKPLYHASISISCKFFTWLQILYTDWGKVLSCIQNPATTSENSARVCLLVCYIFTKFWLCSPGHLIINETVTKGKGLSSLRASVSGSKMRRFVENTNHYINMLFRVFTSTTLHSQSSFSFSRRTKLSDGCLRISSLAVAKPTMPAPTTAMSYVLKKQKANRQDKI